MSNIVSLVDRRREQRVSVGLVWVLEDESRKPVVRGAFKGVITEEGQLVVELPDCTQRNQLELSPKQARELMALLQELAMYGEYRQKKLRGGDKWVSRPGEEPGTFWVRSDKKERLFEPCKIGRRRRAPRCDSCAAVLQQGVVVYRERNPESWEWQSWRDVRLCCSCVETPTSAAIEEVRRS